MSDTTRIQWCDHTASPWYGCTEVSSGCANCYARTLAQCRMRKLTGGGAAVGMEWQLKDSRWWPILKKKGEI